jgi:tetratricopeptide (TPR) repeat protein
MKTLRLLIILPCLLFLGGKNAFAEITSDEALSVFVSAGMAYKEGRYDAAIDKYNAILEGSRASGPLYYNLGNSYFKKGNVGRAVLNYERAKKYIPRDSDLKFNERYARSKIDQQTADTGQSYFERVIQSQIDFYTTEEIIMILFGLGLSIGFLYLVSLYANWRSSTRGWIMATLVFGILVYGFILITKVEYERGLAIVMAETNTFFEPRPDSTVHFQLSEGMKTRILKSEGNWVKIERFDGKAGWIDREVLEKI